MRERVQCKQNSTLFSASLGIMVEGGGKELVWFVLCEVTQVICKTLKKDGIAFRSISNIILITVKWALLLVVI